MTAQSSSIWDEYFLLRYRETMEGKQQIFYGGIHGGVWCRYNVFNPTHREAKRRYRAWKAKWGV